MKKKTSERMLIRKTWNHVIDSKERFILKKEKINLLFREEREEVRVFIFFIRKKNEKKRMVYDYWYLNE